MTLAVKSTSTRPNCPSTSVPSSTRDRRAGGTADFMIQHLSITLSDAGVTADAIPGLAELAAQQWTGTFNPRPFDAKGAEEIYRAAL
jgi:alcohol dehydrogenase class IV